MEETSLKTKETQIYPISGLQKFSLVLFGMGKMQSIVVVMLIFAGYGFWAKVAFILYVSFIVGSALIALWDKNKRNNYEATEIVEIDGQKYKLISN